MSDRTESIAREICYVAACRHILSSIPEDERAASAPVHGVAMAMVEDGWTNWIPHAQAVERYLRRRKK